MERLPKLKRPKPDTPLQRIFQSEIAVAFKSSDESFARVLAWTYARHRKILREVRPVRALNNNRSLRLVSATTDN